MAFQFKIELKNVVKPSVWRRLIVPDNLTFFRFHKVIQAAFGWRTTHLFLFSPNGYGGEPIITVINEDSIKGALPSDKIHIDDIFTTPKQKFSYIYDFGDDWHHNITLEEITEEEITRADCLAGEGACPPEDCGGAGGYADLKKIMQITHHRDHREMREWLKLQKGETFDADKFDLESVRTRLQKI